jgi:hypothetical protein
MQKVHLDLGTHYGQGLIEFVSILKIDKSWLVYSFEANPITYNNFIQTNNFKNLTNILNCIFINKAVYTKDTTTLFNIEYCTHHNLTDGMASTLMPICD